ncbi:MAG: PrsW family glutamic-type intramembrane protease [Patescibacteria group bacterium]
MAKILMPTASTIFAALLGGIIPAIFWLWFWQKEDSAKPEPRGMILFLFLAGMASVVLVIPMQKFAFANITDSTALLLSWAAIEELMKFFVFFLIAAGSRFADEPVDYAIYMITVALGFAAFENTIFLIDPIANQGAVAALLTGNLRFIGASVLHTASSAFVGLFMGLAFFGGAFSKAMHLISGLLTAIALHALFNFFIISNGDKNIFVVFGFLWVAVIIVMLLFEKVKQLR